MPVESSGLAACRTSAGSYGGWAPAGVFRTVSSVSQVSTMPISW